MKFFDTVPRTNLWDSLEEIKVPFKLRFFAIRLCENVISKFENIEDSVKKLITILESRNIVPYVVPFWAYTLTS
jgi:hypothetical protein